MISAGIRLHHAGIDREAFALDQTRIHAGPHHRLEYMAEHVAVAEAAVTIDRKRRMVGHLVVEIEPAEPSIGQVQLDFLAQPPLEADAVAVAHDQHPDHQLGINRWSAFLRHLVDRGLKGVQLIISDACRGLIESAAEYLPEARWQRCMVHFYRNVFSHVPATKIRDVSHMLKAIHAQESRAAADQKARAIIEDLRASKMSKAADLVEQSVHETLTYYAFPDIHWQKIRTNNPLERIMREIRRRTRVVGAFPDGQSCLNLAAARLRYIAGTTWSTKRYMNMQPLYQPQVMQTEAVA